MPEYQIAEVEEGVGYEPIGAALDLWKCKAHEVVIAGPAETGKTRGLLEKGDALLWKYPGLQAVIVRKTRKSMTGSVLQTFENKVINYPNTPIQKFGGNHVEWYQYPNGSRLWVGGMDDPNKILSSERDLVLVNQTEELDKNDWEKLITRATGRAGNMPYPQVIGDANPGPSNHWILGREKENGLVKLDSIHEDNPILYDRVLGEWTTQGQRTISILDNLTGVRKLRLRHGIWASAEGVVYDEFSRIHLCDRFPIPKSWRIIRVIDFGYNNPFVCQWWAEDPDGNIYMFREIYRTHKIVEDHAAHILLLSAADQPVEATICDHDREDRETLSRHGIPNRAAYKAIDRGIEAVKSRLQIQGNGKPRLFIMRDSLVELDKDLAEKHMPVCTKDEFEVYIWADGKKKDVPVDKDNHGMDTIRYAVAYFDIMRGFGFEAT